MIDTRGPGDQRGAAATGVFEIVSGAKARELNELIARKYLTQAGLDHPDVGGSIRANDDVTISFTPDRWRTWGTDSDFDDAFGQPGISLPLDE